MAVRRPRTRLRRVALAAALIGMAAVVRAGGLELDLADGWRMSPGDDPGRAATLFDDSGWKAVRVGVPWGEAGFPGLHGFAWYRKRVVIPAEWAKHPAVRKYGVLVLDLGPVDDADETFVNDVQVGNTGTFPPNYETAWDVPRAYPVPLELIRWGGENSIAVRVYDGQNEAGIYPGPVRLRTPGPADLVSIEIGPANANGVFPASEPVAFTVTITSRTSVPLKGAWRCAWTTDAATRPKTLSSGRAELALPPRGVVSRSFSFRPKGPGFWVANLEAVLPGGEPVRRRFVLGSDVERVQGPEVREPDFDAFWTARRAELAAVPPAFALTPQPDMSSSLVDVSKAEMVSYGGVRIRGWYTVPRKPGRYPGILMVPGYGSEMQPATEIMHAAVLALDIRGHGISRQDMDPGTREYMWEGIEGPAKDYVYIGAYMDCIRGLDCLASRAEVDAARLGVEGGSQGGGLTLATAALDPRVVAAAADVPWLDDWPDYETVAPWAVENYPKLFAGKPHLKPAHVRRTLSYIDVANLAGRIRCPVMVSLGLQDDTCPPRIIMTAYNRIRAPKSLFVYPQGHHDGGGSVHDAIRERWMAEQLGAGK